MKTLAVIPVHGRLPLLKVTIQRLYDKNKVDHVICVGETEDEKTICLKSGAEFITHKNKPLGRKWNAGFLKAKEYNPDAVVYVGSSDWLSDNWIPVLFPLVEKYELIGKKDYNMLHISNDFKLGHWKQYPLGSGREDEPIGIGRLLSNRFLNIVDWQPFDDYLNKSMDYSMMFKLRNKGTCYIYNSPEIQSLSISCDKWSNMHTSDLQQPNVIKFSHPEMWLKIWFPEALKIDGI
jgi:hypothetical protein